MEQYTLKNVNNYLNTNIYSYLETSGGQISNPYLNVVHFFNIRVLCLMSYVLCGSLRLLLVQGILKGEVSLYH
jgi:hypothetical protein